MDILTTQFLVSLLQIIWIDLLLSGDQIFISTDGQGRIYRLSADRHVTLLAQTNEGETNTTRGEA